MSKKAERYSDDDMICRNCANALKRSEFSFKRYGGYAYSWECCSMGDNVAGMYKHSDDTCDKFIKRQNKGHISSYSGD